MDRYSLLRPEGSDLSDASTAVASPPTPQKRYGYRRKKTSESVEPMPTTAEDGRENEEFGSPSQAGGSNQGLGITGPDRRISIPRVPVGAKASPRTPTAASALAPDNQAITGARDTSEVSRNSARSPLSPASPGNAFRDHTDSGDLSGIGLMLEGSTPRDGNFRESSSPEEPSNLYNIEDDAARLKQFVSSNFENEKLQGGCPTTHDRQTSRTSWLSITLLMLSIYSTAMSLLWLITAIIGPRWGRQIYSGGSLSPSTASLLSALLAKTIELSFVTIFISFLGQVLSRRSVTPYSRGVTIAEMSMRTWVIQPGFMLTHWQTLRYAGWTILGVISLIAAIAAMLYTTASDALVSPKLQFGKWEDGPMQGFVRTSYANPQFVEQNCQTPIPSREDPNFSAQTCLALENAGDSYHNYVSWMSTWAEINSNGTGVSLDILERPQAIAMLFDNTTVQGNWIMPSNMSANYEKYNHTINNVTMAMPHANVFAAARDPKNNIMQPNELDGVGGYSIRASVPSPSVNIMCVNVAKDELAPLVYTEWPYALINSSNIKDQRMPYANWDNDVISSIRNTSTSYLNSTPLDDLFQWGEKYTRRPPVFGMFPYDYNTVINHPTELDDTFYLLAKSGSMPDYTVCSMRSFLYPNCSTRHDVSGTAGGSTLASHCDDPDDKQAYALSVPNSPISASPDWVNIAFAWAMAVGLKEGIVNGNASTARLLTQLIPQTTALPTLKPSIAEALAVLAGSTLLLGSTQAAFVHYWEYPAPSLVPGVYSSFNASVMTQQYTSSYIQGWQAAFYPVLFVVAIINVWCLAYYFRRSGLVTDYTEPQNLFALAINSPSSEALSGSCGAGPERYQFQIDWKVKKAAETSHYYIEHGEMWRRKMRDKAASTGYEHAHTPGQSNLQSPDLRHHGRLSSYTKLNSSGALL